MAKKLIRIRKRADDLDLNIREIAEKTEEQGNKVGYKTIYNWINGKYSPKYKNLKAIAEVLKTTPAYLMGETDKTDLIN